jgi:hypothetical protein
MSIKETIQAAEDIHKKSVDMPEWGVTIEVRTMTARERANLFNSCVDKKGNIIHDKFQAGVIIACCFDPESDAKLFGPADENMIMEKSAGAIERLANAAMNISGLSPESMVEAEKK